MQGTTASSSTLFTSPGFASNLTHTIIKETHESDSKSVASDNSNSTSISISDEELALFGAPWAKEGILCKRQAWETIGKKAKNSKWMDVFVVIQKGQLSMFVFGESSGGGGKGGGVVGGGNWAKNANQVGEFMLSHSLAHILPPPGIAKRPNCLVLSLADGAVYFFQAGTEELANEWVSTCNYWAARQSKEPLPGGVSNIEYGWSRVEDVQDDDGSISEAEKALTKERDNRAKGEYSADTFSLRSQRSRLGVRLGDGFSTLRGGSNPYTERIYINEWKAPMPNMHVSTLDEEGQLESLQRQAETLKEELKKHDAFKAPMTALVSGFFLYTATSDVLSRSSSTLPSRPISRRP
jgi:PH/SEC7 domain-containing protein